MYCAFVYDCERALFGVCDVFIHRRTTEMTVDTEKKKLKVALAAAVAAVRRRSTEKNEMKEAIFVPKRDSSD